MDRKTFRDNLISDLAQSGHTLPQKYIVDPSKRHEKPELKDLLIGRGWVIDMAQTEKISKWILDHHPERACHTTMGDLDIRITYALSGNLFVRDMGLYGGVATSRLQHSIENTLYVDTNCDDPEEYTKPEQWAKMAHYLGLEGMPNWYLSYV
ncbi:hypothetical protein MSAN_02404400 [Mycena sanguinolenta]|uniref:Uncharacterized protein n=1 Tax=Mycena sanguinolenta TaxID=230812 RepID=A0A8H6X4K9_9AGAR|nr:hypothetical protein MSAN_02404400 [Mycena sanguinolenta]